MNNIKNKLQNIPHKNKLNLSDLLDIEALQSLINDFYKLTKIGMGIIDRSGKVLVAVGWQNICVKFHRCHPETLKNCLESDTQLSLGIPEGTFKSYRCLNHMWDIATPLIIGGQHVGNIFLGQFIYEDQEEDINFFRNQAKKYGFDEDEYLNALSQVPRWSRETINTAMAIYTKFAGIIASLSYQTLQANQELNARKEVQTQLEEKEKSYQELFHGSRDGFVSVDLNGKVIDANKAYCQMLGYTLEELKEKNNFYEITPEKWWAFEKEEMLE